jgi:hypothetical protein
MQDQAAPVDPNKLIARIKGILLTPRTEWPLIAAEPASIGSLYTGYILIMAAIPAVIRFVSSSLIGVPVPFLGYYRIDVGTGLTLAVVSYVLSLLGVFIVALIVEALAPTFSGEKSRVQALKVVAYSYTASWVAAIIGIIPGLVLLSALLGLIYGLYLLNLGLPFTMKCPPEKSIAYTAVTIIAAIIVGFVLNLVIGSVGGYGYGMRHNFSGPPPHAGIGSGAQIQAVGTLIGTALGSGGKVESLPADRIKPFLPATLDGLQRTQAAAERNAALGMQLSKATATYSDGSNHTLNLEITDTGSLKGLVGFAAGWGGVEQDSETDTGYEKTYNSGGELVHEKWDRQSQSGEYGVVIADRFTVKVSGSAPSIDILKHAVATIDTGGLAALRNEGVQAN